MKPFRITLLTFASLVALYACGSGTTSSADTGVTSAQVQTMIASAIAPLQQQIATLQSQVGATAPAVFIKAPNAPAVKVAEQSRTASQKAAAQPSCTGLGTLTGRPDSSDPIASNDISGVSCTGYYYTISGAATSAQSATVQPPPSVVTLGFDAPNCTGNAYVLASFNGTSISSVALANGAVFTSGDPTVSASYWMLTPNTAVSNPYILSVLNGKACSGWSGVLSAYALQQNVQATSGVPSAPIPGPVTIG